MSVSARPASTLPYVDAVVLDGARTLLRLGEAIELYLGYQRRRGRRPATLRSASVMLRAFLRWAGSEVPVSQITRASVELEFFADWHAAFEARHGGPPSTSTSRCLLGAIKGLFQFLDAFDLLCSPDGAAVRNPLAHLDIPPAAPPRRNALRPEAAAALIAAARTPHERIVVNLLRWTGMRSGEAAVLTTADIDLDRSEIHIRRSKTERGVRTLPLLDALHDPFQEWLTYRDNCGLLRESGPLLVTEDGTATCTRNLWRVVRRVSERARIFTPNGSLVTPHALRRTFATDLLNRGVRLEVVSRLLGHASTTITEHAYATLSDQRVREEVAAALRQ
jgi:integrase